MKMNREEFQQLVDDYLDGRLEGTRLNRLENALRKSSDARRDFWKRAHLHAALRNLAEEDSGSRIAAEEVPTDAPASTSRRRLHWVSFAAAAVVIVAAFALSWPPPADPIVASDEEEARSAPDGVAATITRLVDADWEREDSLAANEDLARGRRLDLRSGLVEFRFASGALAVIEGPTSVVIEDRMQLRLLDGTVEMNVPPAAHGFEVLASNSLVRDLGTRFTVRCRNGERSELHVAEGRVELIPSPASDPQVVAAGQAVAASPQDDVTPIRYLDRNLARELTDRIRFANWRSQRDALARDEQVLVYFTFAPDSPPGQVRNLASRTKTPRFGNLTPTTARTDGRWPEVPALRFDEPDDRVRVKIEGVHRNLTFTAWVRPDRLANGRNSLFMSEFGIDGEAHWQLADNGSFLFAVRRDKAAGPDGYHAFPGGPALAAGDASRWHHLATTYSADTGQVVHYLDGAEVARFDEGYLPALRFGHATLGNWQPFEPEVLHQIDNGEKWMTRFWNGAIDEFVLVARSLSDGEIRQLWHAGRP